MWICPGHIGKTIKRVRIVKWDAFLKRIDFIVLTFLEITFHLTIFTRLLVFTICLGQIEIVKWNFWLNHFVASYMFSQQLGIVKCNSTAMRLVLWCGNNFHTSRTMCSQTLELDCMHVHVEGDTAASLSRMLLPSRRLLTSTTNRATSAHPSVTQVHWHQYCLGKFFGSNCHFIIWGCSFLPFVLLLWLQHPIRKQTENQDGLDTHCALREMEHLFSVSLFVLVTT